MVYEQMALEHRRDLLREAGCLRRVARAARAGRTGSRVPARLAAALHLRPTVVGCQA